MDREDLKPRRKDKRWALLECQRVVSDDLHPLVDKVLCGIHSRTGRVVPFVFHGVALEKLTPSCSDEYRITSPQPYPLHVSRIPQVPRGDLELLRQRAGIPLDHGRHVEQHAAVDQQIRRIVIYRQAGTGPARAYAVRVAGRFCGVHAAEQAAVPADMPDGVDARRAVLAAEMHDLGGKRELAAITERTTGPRALGRYALWRCKIVGGYQLERVRRVH